jgi:hypothetical protein
MVRRGGENENHEGDGVRKREKRREKRRTTKGS